MSSVLGSSVGYVLLKWASQMGSYEPFVADKMMGQIIEPFVGWPGLAKKAGAGDSQPMGLSVSTVTTVHPC